MNRNRIYYFSATGNSLVVARRIAEHLDDCEGCFACLHWCPKRAITVRGFEGVTQGHHPECKIKDMIRK